jgi:hypothetical protein
MDCGLWRYRRVYNEMPINEEGIPAHKGVRVHDSSMGKDSGVGACSAFTDGNDVFDGSGAAEEYKS